MGAFGVSITTFVSQNYGAMKYDRVKKSIKVCLGMAFLFTVVVSTFFLVFANPLYHLFTSDANVLELGLMMMRYMAPFYWTYIFVEIDQLPHGDDAPLQKDGDAYASHPPQDKRVVLAAVPQADRSSPVAPRPSVRRCAREC